MNRIALRWRYMLTLVILLLVLCSGVTQAFSQTTVSSGTLKGIVLDPQEAVVPGATITVTNASTAVVRTTRTDDSGNFTVPSLPVGTYLVKVEKQGFKVFQENDVAVNISGITEVRARLQIGGANEVVTVEANAVTVQTSSAAVGEVIDLEKASQLPLNGSNFVELTLLQPGVSRANNFGPTNKGLIGGVDFSVNGNPVTNNLFLIDGVNNNDVGSNRTILAYPSVEAIAEFNMLRNSYGPEYGQASGAVISIATKSGTNDWHGSLNYSGRNDYVGAEDAFAKLANAGVVAAGGSLPHNGKDELRRNDVNYTFGGPIKKDKIFFFWSQEFNREIEGYTRSSCVPTAAEASGDFSQGFVNGKDACGAAQPTIPTALQAPGNPFKIANPSPAALLIMKQFPTPNALASAATNNNNWFDSTPSPLNFRDETAKVDINLTKTERLAFRYTHENWTNNSPSLAANGFLWGEDAFPAIEGNWYQPSQSAFAKVTSTLSDTLINEAQFGYSGNQIVTTPGGTNPGLAAQIENAIPTVFPASGKGIGGIPTFWGGAISPYFAGNNLWTIAPYHNNMDLYTIRDDISKVLKNHSLKAGVYLSFNAKNEDQFGGQDRPTFGSAEAWNVTQATGSDLANLLLPGQVFTNISEQNINPNDQGRWRDYEFYVGDTWKARRNLTVEAGFRWSILPPPYAANNAFGIFNPAHYNPAIAFINGQPNECDGLDVVPGTTFCQQAAKLTGIPYSNGTPSAFGRSLLPTNHHDIAPRLGVSWDVFGDGKTALRAGLGQFYQRERVSIQVGLSNSVPFAVQAVANRTLDALPAASAITFGGGSSNSAVVTPNTPNSWQWNFSVERELHRDTALELGYIGNRGIHLTSIFDLNAVLPQNRTGAEAFTTNGGTINATRPFPSLGSIFTGGRNGYSSYNALQGLFRTKLPKVVTLQAAYTWSHTISNVDQAASNGLGSNASNITDPFNPNLDKGNSTINRPQMFVANAIWYLPKLNGGNAVLRSALGGWELSTIETSESGNSITVFASGAAGTGVGNGIFGDGFSGNNRPLIVKGTSCNSGAHGSQVLNPNAFTLNGFAIGSDINPLLEPRGYCHAPSLQTTDLAIYKNFKLKERFNLQFRVDAFNAFNHLNIRGDQINNDWSSNATASCGALPCGPGNNVITSSILNQGNHFGQATGDAGFIGPRQIQYGLRFTF